jgi:hypothetical protein
MYSIYNMTRFISKLADVDEVWYCKAVIIRFINKLADVDEVWYCKAVILRFINKLADVDGYVLHG